MDFNRSNSTALHEMWGRFNKETENKGLCVSLVVSKGCCEWESTCLKTPAHKLMLQFSLVSHTAWFGTSLTQWQAKIPLIRKTRSSIFLQLCRSSFITLFAQTVSRAQVEVGLSCPARKRHVTFSNSRRHWLVWTGVAGITGDSSSDCQSWTFLLLLRSPRACPSCSACTLPWCKHNTTLLFPVGVGGDCFLLSPGILHKYYFVVGSEGAANYSSPFLALLPFP